MRSSHAWSRSASHRHGSEAVLPGTTSRSWPRRTSTICVDHDWVRNRPTRANKRLVQAERGDITEAVGMIDELLADDHDGVHHGVPAATEFACHV